MRVRCACNSVTKQIAVFVVCTTELHGSPHSSAGAGPPPLCSGGGGLAVHPIRDFLIFLAISIFVYRGFAVVFLNPIRDFLIYFAIFSFLYRGLQRFFFRPCLTKSLLVVPTHALMRRKNHRSHGLSQSYHIKRKKHKTVHSVVFSFYAI